MFRILLFSVYLLFHPVHVTITSIDYIPEMASFNVFVRMSYDDFLLDRRLTDPDIQQKEFTESDSDSRIAIEKYIKEKITLKVNQKEISGKLEDLKLTDNEISINLEYYSGRKPETVTVKNLIMTGLHRDQSNMIIVKVNDFEEGVKLTSDITEQTFKIK
jgi:hypothetical protein